MSKRKEDEHATAKLIVHIVYQILRLLPIRVSLAIVKNVLKLAACYAICAVITLLGYGSRSESSALLFWHVMSWLMFVWWALDSSVKRDEKKKLKQEARDRQWSADNPLPPLSDEESEPPAPLPSLEEWKSPVVAEVTQTEPRRIYSSRGLAEESMA